MKRLYISLALIGLICGGGIWNIHNLRTLTHELSDLLEQAETAAIAEDWGTTTELTQQAFDLWEQNQLYVHVAMHHSAIEDVETSFEAVKAFIRWEETPEYTSSNATLLTQIEHIWASERFCWENLF